MPTAPDPNSPFLASRLEATLGVRAPGTPSISGQPGAQAANVSFPAPPGAASAPVGRPATPQAPQPGAPVPATPTPKAATPGTKQPAVKPAAGAAPVANPAVPMPLGTPVTSANGGAPDLLISPEGDARYREAVLQGRESLGPIPRIFRHASLPEMPFELGAHNYNPFTGAWSDRPDAGGGGM